MRQKIRHLRLEVVGAKLGYKTTTSIKMPEELPSVEEEKQLRELVDAKASIEVIMVKMHKSMDSVKKKCVRLGLEVDGDAKKILAPSSSSGLKLPEELQGVDRPRSQCNASSSPRRLRLVNYYQMQPKTPCKVIMTTPISAGHHQVAMHSRLRAPCK